MISSRFLAYQILLHLDQKLSQPDRLIRAILERHSEMDRRDRALTTELVYGVLRWQGKLDWHIDQLSKINPKKIDPAIRISIRLALYQILFLDRIPVHAAVNESVKIVKATQPAYLTKFVNGLLREAIRRQGRWELPSAETHLEDYLAITTSHPKWFIHLLLPHLGFQEALELCTSNNQVAPIVLRVNTLKENSADLLDRLQSLGITAKPSPFLPDSVRISGLRQDVSQLSIFTEGLVQVQDEASQLVSHLLSPEPGERLLDLCSGFGGKSTQFGIRMKNEGEILAVDQSAWKLEELRENAARQGVSIVETNNSAVTELSTKQLGEFDRVFLDAPCSGFGSLRRNPDIKWRRHLKDPIRFARLQKELLSYASRFVKRGGVLVYATCTIFREENEEVADDFTSAHSEFSIESAAHFLPHDCQSLTEGLFFRSWPHRHDIDGFFAARWRKG